MNDNEDERLPTDIIVLTKKEHTFVCKMLKILESTNPAIYTGINNRLKDMKQLAETIAHFPSLLDPQVVFKETRDKLTLTDSLLEKREGDKMLHFPSKATLGKGFLVAKFHLFAWCYDIAEDIGMDEADIAEAKSLTSSLLFTIMVEDVYLNLLDETELPKETRRQAAMALIILWERRTGFIAKDIAPVLQNVWDSRKKLIPVFGTLMGAYELVNLSGDQGSKWRDFMRAMPVQGSAMMSLEEFLFGLAFEEICRLKEILVEKDLHSINRQQISDLLGKKINPELNSDPRDFYMFYTVRRDNARARRKFNLPGPQNTLEDYYIQFVLKEYKDTQYNDIFFQ
jgi:hypothetical protein